MKRSPLISATELAVLDKDQMVIIDAGSGADAYAHYCLKHIDGALYVDLNKDLADIPENPKHGGRHPLPSIEKFAALLFRLGIDVDSHVVIYDDKNAANAAARFWWMLRAAGVQKVQVLDGGFQMAKSAGLDINAKVAAPKKVKKLNLKDWRLPLADLNFIEKYCENSDFVIIDVRDSDRYEGKTEPIDMAAGHIPGAVNIPFKKNLNADGTFKQPQILREMYAKAITDIPSRNIAVHCGSGVTACHTLLALDYAGFDIPSLYVGSWSEWSRNGKPVIKNSI